MPPHVAPPAVHSKKVRGGQYTGYKKNVPDADRHTAKIVVTSTPNAKDARGYDQATVTIRKTRSFGNAFEIVNQTRNSKNKVITRHNKVQMHSGKLFDHRNKEWHAMDNQVIQNILADVASIAEAAGGYFPISLQPSTSSREKARALFDQILDQEDIQSTRLVFE